MNMKRFKTLIYTYYRASGRHDLPWRKTRDPYKILVSESMLQQTQVPRVLKKYNKFLTSFPTAKALAQAPTAQVLTAWQGLGYNRRALNLKRACEIVVNTYDGIFPKTAEELEALPGIGQSTRGAIMAFAYNIPTVFIETNIRSIFIHHFFDGVEKIHDKEILPLIEKTLDRAHPRDWYYALMDYGVHLKQTLPNPSRNSIHHVKQSAFKGSNREMRSKILAYILKENRTENEIIQHIGMPDRAIKKNIQALTSEGFIVRKNGTYSIAH